jgi:hypothetical protein
MKWERRCGQAMGPRRWRRQPVGAGGLGGRSAERRVRGGRVVGVGPPPPEPPTEGWWAGREAHDSKPSYDRVRWGSVGTVGFSCSPARVGAGGAGDTRNARKVPTPAPSGNPLFIPFIPTEPLRERKTDAFPSWKEDGAQKTAVGMVVGMAPTPTALRPHQPSQAHGGGPTVARAERKAPWAWASPAAGPEASGGGPRGAERSGRARTGRAGWDARQGPELQAVILRGRRPLGVGTTSSRAPQRTPARWQGCHRHRRRQPTAQPA